MRDSEVRVEDRRVYFLSEMPLLSSNGIYLGQPLDELLERLGPAERFSMDRGTGALRLYYGVRGGLTLFAGRLVSFQDE